MKVKKIEEQKGFRPYVLELSVETMEEHMILDRLTSMDITIPKFVELEIHGSKKKTNRLLTLIKTTIRGTQDED